MFAGGASSIFLPAFQSEINLALAFDSLPTSLVICALDGTIQVVNRQAEREFGYSRDELIGESVDVLVPDALRVMRAPAPADFLSDRSRQVRRPLWRQKRDGSSVPVALTLSPLKTDRGQFLVASITDAPVDRDRSAATAGAQPPRDFEHLFAEISRQLVNAVPDQLGDGIRDALRRIGEAFNLDRCTFFRMSSEGIAQEQHSWTAAGIASFPQTTAAAERFPWALETGRNGGFVCFSSLAEVPHAVDRATYEALRIRSSVAVPLWVEGQLAGALSFHMVRDERKWDREVVHRLRTLATVFSTVLARQQSEEALQRVVQEVARLRDRLEVKDTYLRQTRDSSSLERVMGESRAVRQVLEQVRLVAATDSSVLLLGETGTGKELFATHIHELSARHARPMVRVNCAAIPSGLMESELFGRERGAFTGAHARQIGRFELADRSTIFLDEIGELAPEIQVKLLRVLEERQLERLGSPKPIRVDTRIIAATHRNLEQRIAEGSFREDLYYRLNVFPIRVPPLRERVEDIPMLVWAFVADFAKSFGKRIDVIPRDNLAALQRYSWPGNIRELRNVVERAMIGVAGPTLTIPVPTMATSPVGRHSDKLADVETEHIRGILEAARWRIRGIGGAAERLGLRPTTLETRMAKLGVTRPGR